jgi:hypothetical protein
MSELTAGAMIESDGNPHQPLVAENFNAAGDIKGTKPEILSADLALVVGTAQAARDFLLQKQWNLLWRDADLLFQAPRPMTVYDNTYVLEPNVQRFTVAKIVNSVVPQLYKGLFYDDPPMILRPRPGEHQNVVDAKTALMSYILDKSKFKTETKWGLETMAHLGTGIWKWGYDWVTIETSKRKAAVLKETVGPDQQPQTISIPLDEPPTITTVTKVVPMPFFEHRPLDKVLVDPKLDVPDIREAKNVVDVRYMDFYEMYDLQQALELEAKEDKSVMDGWSFPEKMKEAWIQPPAPASNLQTEQTLYMKGAVHHAQDVNVQNAVDPLRTKLEVLEYWDAKRKIIVLDGKKVIYTGDNEFKRIPFLSSNWWNRPKAFFGMGLGLIVGQNQRVDQGTINAILKILSYGVNPIYLKRRDGNNLTQMVKTNVGKIMTVDGDDVSKAFSLMETPKIPGDIWNALRESEQATESSSGADQQLVQGSSAGPRSSMGRTSGGAAIQASASATRLDGPLDNFIEQVFKPFLYIVDEIVFKKMSDAAIIHILGDVLGMALTKNLDMQRYWDSQIDFEVLAGASMAAKRTMSQSMVMLTQFLDNPQLTQALGEMDLYVDYNEVFKMWMQASEWKNGNDIVKPMPPDKKAKRDANSPAALAQMRNQSQQQANNDKFAQRQELEDQSSNNRIKRDLVIASAKASGLSETVEGVPSTGGLAGQEPTVE